MVLKTWLLNIIGMGSKRGPRIDEIWALTQQFHLTLQAFITKAEESAPQPPPKALERILEIKSDVNEEMKLPINRTIQDTKAKKLTEEKSKL